MSRGPVLALAGLLRLMMGADGKLTLREHRFIAELAGELGGELWTSLAKAEIELPSDEAIKKQAARVTRAEPRARIRQILGDLAHADGVADAEQALLDWLDALWAEIPADA